MRGIVVSCGRSLILVAAIALLWPAPLAAQPSAGKPPKPCNPRKAPCPDVTGPVVTITNPEPDAIVSGLMTVTGTASDNVGVSLVEVQIDDDLFLPATGTTSWSLVFESSALPDGGH